MSLCDTWLVCPQLYGNDAPGQKCGAPAEILDRQVLSSTDGPVTHVKTRCAAGHILHCPLEAFA